MAGLILGARTTGAFGTAGSKMSLASGKLFSETEKQKIKVELAAREGKLAKQERETSEVSKRFELSILVYKRKSQTPEVGEVKRVDNDIPPVRNENSVNRINQLPENADERREFSSLQNSDEERKSSLTMLKVLLILNKPEVLVCRQAQTLLAR